MGENTDETKDAKSLMDLLKSKGTKVTQIGSPDGGPASYEAQLTQGPDGELSLSPLRRTDARRGVDPRTTPTQDRTGSSRCSRTSDGRGESGSR